MAAELVVQILTLRLFFLQLLFIKLCLRGQPTRESLAAGNSWARTLYVIGAVNALILFRLIFRVVEYVQDHNKYLLGHEWMLYVWC